MDAGASGEPGWRGGCHGRTLLGAAACGKSEKVVRALLEAGAADDVNVLFGAEHESALHVAAARGAEEASKALMVAGADPNLCDKGESSPLHLAAKAGHDRVVSLLLLKGAQVDAKGYFGDTPLTLAAFGGHALCISELLLGGADKDGAGDGNETPLFKAAARNHLQVVEMLLSAGADRCRTADGGWSPLDIAANKGHPTIVKAFLETGSKVDTADDQGRSALHNAAGVGGPVRGNGAAVVRVLLEAGADVNAKADHNWGSCTPLHLAVNRRTASMGTIRALLEGGANVNNNAHGDVNGTPLHVACMHANVSAVELLLQWGADENCSDGNGDTPAGKIGALYPEGLDDEGITADHESIRRMLARAPADRSWRRRGWLVLIRSCPTRVQIANRVRNGSSNRCSAKVARVDAVESGGDEEETEDKMMVDWRDLVDRLVALEADGLFRSIVGFLFERQKELGAVSLSRANRSRLILLRARWRPLPVDSQDAGYRVATEAGVPEVKPWKTTWREVSLGCRLRMQL
ncbi:unnamed protein product [Ectocarpus fasciculatus]